MNGFIITVVLAFAFGLGWGICHNTIANECDKIGAFYVGDRIYECKAKQTK